MSPLPPGVRRAFRLALRRPRIEVEVDEEVAFHSAMRTEELMARGLSSDEARAEAQRRFGNTRYWSRAMRDTDLERVRAHRRMEWLDSVRQDARYALRTFARAPLLRRWRL